jgi:hypothetical protein
MYLIETVQANVVITIKCHARPLLNILFRYQVNFDCWLSICNGKERNRMDENMFIYFLYYNFISDDDYYSLYIVCVYDIDKTISTSLHI